MNKTKKNIVPLIECHILMSEAIKGYGNIELQCSKMLDIKEYKNRLPEDLYKKIDDFVQEVIRPMVYDVDYFSWLKTMEYGSYNDDNHFIINSDSSLEMIIFKKYYHMQELLHILSKFASDELHLNYN